MAEKLRDKFQNWLFKQKPVIALITASDRLILPSFDGLSVYEVAIFFIRGIQQGQLRSRASAIAFNFFLAIFPTILFLFTLIPYLPIHNSYDSLMKMLAELIPDHAFKAIESTIRDILTHKQGGLVSIGFLMAGYFSTNGIRSVIEAFNISIHAKENRTVFRQRLASIFLVILLAVLTLTAITLITAGKGILQFLVHKKLLVAWIYYYLLLAGNWVVIISLIYFGISFIYYFAPARQMRFRFFSAGSSLATFLVLLLSVGFNFYVSNFSRYNALYGSIGTLIIVLLWIYFNASILLLGFELNASIILAKEHKNK
ncbi:MAG: YihY/virulence factor BrkB family protein [Bacteroidota bacterium]